MTTPVHSCLHQGHIWIEADGSLYVRHRERQGTVDVSCLYCDTNATLAAHGKATNPAFLDAKEALTAILAEDAKSEVPTLAAKIQATKAAFALTSAPAKDLQ